MLRSLRLLLAAALVACGSPETTPPDAGSADAAPADGGAPEGDAAVACEARWVRSFEGRVETADGAPVEGARPQLCARVAPDDHLVCLTPPSTDGAGAFTIEVPDEVRCLRAAAMRVLAPGQPFGTTYCPIALGEEGATVAIDAPFALVPVAEATVPPRGDGASERVVALPEGVELTLAPDALIGDGYERLAGGLAAVDPPPCFAEGMALDGAYVFAPEGPVAGGAGLRLPNRSGLPPGTEVDLYVLGGLETALMDGTAVEEAELARFGGGVVSADGASIEPDAAARLPYLSWVAWRAR